MNFIFSPILTPKELLRKFPKVDIFVCSKDPLHDDAIRFGHKLIEEKRDCEITVFKYLPHGMLNFDVPNGMPEAKEFVYKTIGTISKLFS